MTVGDLLSVLTLREGQDVLVYPYAMGDRWKPERATQAMLLDRRHDGLMRRRVHQIDCGDLHVWVYAYPSGGRIRSD